MKLTLDILKNNGNNIEANILLGELYLFNKPKLRLDMTIYEVKQYIEDYERYMGFDEDLIDEDLIDQNETVLINYIKEVVNFDIIPKKYQERVMLLSLRQSDNTNYTTLYDNLEKYVKIFKQ